jgi:NAD(P)-dependent dehydrogenase (short-subunit alcohol dehydrogenase family)
MIVTGGASGIGLAIARALATGGANVTLTARDLHAGERAAQDIKLATGNQSVRAAHLDLADAGSVGAFVDSWDGPLDVLVNNAGAMIADHRRSREGWEWHLAINHLSHFLLASQLHQFLAASGAARIVAVSSRAHLRTPVDFEDPHFDRRPYEKWLAYGQSKTANVLFAVAATDRWSGDRITANATTPGPVQTNMQRNITAEERSAMEASGPTEWKTPEQGAATSVLAATWPGLDGVGGRYFEDCNEAAPHEEGTKVGVASYALDASAAHRLWVLSAHLTDGQSAP